MMRIASLWLLAACVAAALPGCSPAPSEPEPELPKLRIMLKMGEAFRTEDNRFLQELERRLHIDLEIETPPAAGYRERLNVVMASGDLPDIVQLDWFGEGNFANWVANGLLQPIEIDKTKHIVQNVPRNVLSMMRVAREQGDMRVYGVPGSTVEKAPYGAIIRKDWLDKLGLKEPATLEQFTFVMKAFVEQDPDRNGKDDTTGFVSYRLNEVGGVFGSAFAADYLWGSLHSDPRSADGKAKLREEQGGYMSLLDHLRGMYAGGLLDKQFFQVQNKDLKFVQGRAGMTGGYANTVIQLEKELRKTVPEARLTWVPGPSDPNGKHWNFAPDSYGFGGAGSAQGAGAVFLVTRSADRELALRFLDEMNSKEMILLSSLGVQGVHYESFDEFRKVLMRTDAQTQATNRELFRVSDAYRGEQLVSLGANEELFL